MSDDKKSQDLSSRLSSLQKKKEGADAIPEGAGSLSTEKKDTPKMNMIKDVASSNVAIQNKEKQPVGLDIGTSHIVMAQGAGDKIQISTQLNAFFTVPNSKVTFNTLKNNRIKFFEFQDNLYIVGYNAQDFANMFHTDLRRPIEFGIVSPKEEEGMAVIQAMLNDLIPKPKNFGEVLCYGVPGEPVKGTGAIVYHEAILGRYIRSMGYSPMPINEGLATIMAELQKDSFSGIGISMGGGMCNVCMAFMSVPIFSFSIQKGGDYVNHMAAQSIGESATKVKQIKEEELDFTKAPDSRVMTALNIFYEDLVSSLLENLQQVILSTDRMPRFKQALPIVISGGTAMPNGFDGKFKKLLKKYALPIEISDVRVAEDPLNTTAKGALYVANNEEIE
ncbi:MAG: hypothetical protein HQK75_19345 [Candidatus Magnetomorum sp.]|nr:hypothetical protein [Candidatus Magnetomorum sp.]